MTKQLAERLSNLAKQANQELKAINATAELETWRVTYIGRKGKIPQLLRSLKDLSLDERRQTGQQGNKLRQELEDAFKQKQTALGETQSANRHRQIPNTKYQIPTEGHLHPLTLSLRRIREIFAAMGFFIIEGPDVEEAKYNFDQLNIPFEHPARAESDTFYLKGLPDLVMRTHVSPLQVRGVIENNLKAPFRTMYYGPSYRSEKEDATHLSHFQQYEFMVVDETVNLADLKSIVQNFYSLFFGSDFDIRFRPAYYPFVEPGLDVDMRDRVTGKGEWLEMAGAGIVHPNVLRNINVDPNKFQGIALGGGVDRLAMLKYGVPDARLFYSGDLRFLNQF